MEQSFEGFNARLLLPPWPCRVHSSV